MLKSTVAGLVALGVLVGGAASAAAQTIKVLIVQEDADDTSLRRDTRIQRNILNAFNQGLNAPSAADLQRKYGIGGMDVFDETSLSVDWYPQGRKRRADPELISLAREIRNPRLDVLVLYTLHAKAVDRHAMPGVTALHMSLSYRALDIRSGRYLGGENLDLDSNGIVATGCAASLGGRAASDHCIHEFVAGQGERLVRDAAITLSTQLAAMASGHDKGDRREAREDVPKGKRTSSKDSEPDLSDNRFDCRARPVQYLVTFSGIPKQHVNLITQRMDEWPCGIDLGLERSSPSEASYSYNVRATEAELKRRLDISLEFLRIEGHVETRGRNELVVRAIPIRRN